MAEIQGKLRKHFESPDRIGEIADADGTGIVGNSKCGEILTFQIKVQDGVIAQVRFQCLGCGAAKAVASYVAELAEGRPVAEVEKIRMEDIFRELEGLPKSKWHCPFQAVDALRMAIEDWREHGGKGTRQIIEVEPLSNLKRCPFCEELLGDDAAACASCEDKTAKCKNCGREVPL
jgi:nitrogen fixation protein NifU and related proteins